MPYIGNPPAEAYTNTVKDSFNGDGSTVAFTMSQPSLTNDVRVVVENVVQDPTVAYSCSGTTLTFTSAPPVGTNNIYVVHLGPAIQTAVPPGEISAATTFASNVTVQGAFTSRGIDDNATSTAMTLDTSGNLLVGKTSNSFGTAGVALNPSGSNNMTRASDPPLALNRLTSDGDILGFYKDGSTVGSIGTPFTNELYIQATGANSSGLLFTSGNTIQPRKNSAADDGNIDIGTGGNRFKSLYLSGGVYLGGTGAANYLDDYESGTWTPTDPSGIFTGLTNVNCYYRKIGSFVYLYGRLSWSSTDNSGNLIAIGGLPFVDNSGGNSPSSGTTMIASSSWNTSTSSNSVTPHIPSGQSYLNFYPHMQSTYGAYPASSASGATEVIFQIAYVAT